MGNVSKRVKYGSYYYLDYFSCWFFNRTLSIYVVVFFPDYVLNELARALVAKGIPCQQKGYILRGKFRDASGFAKLSFELEVCRIPNLNVIGIRRKRLKGDAW